MNRWGEHAAGLRSALSDSDRPQSDLGQLIRSAAAGEWLGTAANELAEAIEHHVVRPLPSRLRSGLGRDEAEQLARVLAWAASRELAAKPPSRGVSWGYLANLVRWRVADAVRAEALRRHRHTVVAVLPERSGTPLVEPLGDNLDRIAQELCREGLPLASARRLLLVATDGPRFERAAIAARLTGCGVDRSQADGMAWLLRGGAIHRSALYRLAMGEPPAVVFADAVVRRWVKAAAGRDPGFRAGRTGKAVARTAPGNLSPSLQRTA
ncbi:hypothetical protein [Kribbella deserti]|uniref:Sigma-70 family RNA polymerase sigma factor n=1 Tax=Kribbella deserti TaxID=1926257 RepID=A0ABV6QTF8_9ACTN